MAANPSEVRSTGGLYSRYGKRVFDLALALPALTFLAPLLAFTALAIRYRMGRQVMFRQQRVGWRETVFRLNKFRSMTDGRDATGQLLPDEQRLDSFGLFLRRTSLDELPQLWNVVCGEMSLIGPRPLLVRYLTRYTPRQRQRHLVRPGITGWAQVHGRNRLSWDERFELDLHYIENCSLLLDFEIIWLTFRRAFSAADTAARGGADVEEFWGTAKPPPGAPRSRPADEVESSSLAGRQSTTG